MGHKKLIRYNAIKEFEQVLEYPQNMPGAWHAYFKNAQPITLELACGRGEYTVGLAAMHPQKNFIGVDIKGNRIYVGARLVREKGLQNAAFLRAQIDHIQDYFAPDEVSEIWITFPDPQLRKGKAKKRLTHPLFLKRYQLLLQPQGRIHLKTDSPALYHFTLQVIKLFSASLHLNYTDAYGQSTNPEITHIKTYYESRDIAGSGRIYYLCFSLPQAWPPSAMEALNAYILKEETGAELSIAETEGMHNG